MSTALAHGLSAAAEIVGFTGAILALGALVARELLRRRRDERG